MAVRNFQSFMDAKNAKETMEKSMMNAKKKMLLDLLDEITPFVQDMTDIRDTYLAVKREDKGYANKLWHFLTQYTDGKYDKKYHLDINSYFGVRYEKSGLYYVNVTITPLGLAIYCDPNSHEETDDWKSKNYKGNNAISYITNHYFSEEILDKYIESVKGLMEWFPRYSEKFFDLVRNPEF